MDNLAFYLIGAFALLILVLNVVATIVVCRTYFIIKQRLLYQLLFVWLVPIFGALLILYIDREDDIPPKPEGQIGNHPEVSDTYAGSLTHNR